MAVPLPETLLSGLQHDVRLAVLPIRQRTGEHLTFRQVRTPEPGDVVTVVKLQCNTQIVVGRGIGLGTQGGQFLIQPVEIDARVGRQGNVQGPPDNTDIVAELINYYLLGGKAEEALNYIRIGQEKDPKNVSLLTSGANFRFSQ